MDKESLFKILFVLTLLRNRVDEKHKEYANEMIDMIHEHLGVKSTDNG